MREKRHRGKNSSSEKQHNINIKKSYLVRGLRRGWGKGERAREVGIRMPQQTG